MEVRVSAQKLFGAIRFVLSVSLEGVRGGLTG